MPQLFNYGGRWYTLEQYQKLLNPVEVKEESVEEIGTPVEEVLETLEELEPVEVKPTLKPKTKKSNKK